jgi:hypothetical protein
MRTLDPNWAWRLKTFCSAKELFVPLPRRDIVTPLQGLTPHGGSHQISFADWELQHGPRGVRLEPLLEAISNFLDDQAEMIECIRHDLVRGLKKSGVGRRRVHFQ